MVNVNKKVMKMHKYVGTSFNFEFPESEKNFVIIMNCDVTTPVVEKIIPCSNKEDGIKKLMDLAIELSPNLFHFNYGILFKRNHKIDVLEAELTKLDNIEGSSSIIKDALCTAYQTELSKAQIYSASDEAPILIEKEIDVNGIIKIQRKTIKLVSFTSTLPTINGFEFALAQMYPVSISNFKGEDKIKPYKIKTIYEGGIKDIRYVLLFPSQANQLKKCFYETNKIKNGVTTMFLTEAFDMSYLEFVEFYKGKL